MHYFGALLLIAASASASPISPVFPVGEKKSEGLGLVAEKFDFAKIARFIVSKSDWATLGHISQKPPHPGYPTGRVIAISDAGTGVPYMYTTLWDPLVKELQIDPRSFMTMTLAQSPYCASKNVDVSNPACPQITLVGEFELVKPDTKEHELAQKSLFARHPEMLLWPKDHGFVVAKLHVKNLRVTASPKGPHSGYPSVEEYMSAIPHEY